MTTTTTTDAATEWIAQHPEIAHANATTTTDAGADKMTADEIGEDVQTFHIEHMDECEYCTWWYCAHYPCDCE